MNLTDNQLDLLAKYFSDISKILVASTVIGFFIPFDGNFVSVEAFLTGSFIAIILLTFSIKLVK